MAGHSLSPSTAVERRDAARLQGRWPTVLRHDGKSFNATCLDMSRTGAGLQGEPPLPLAIGSIVDATIEIGSGQTLDVTGEVVRRDEGGGATVGLRFVRLDQGSLMRLYTLLATAR